MATPGGPEQIGAVNIGVEANIDPLIRDLEKAKAEAARKGEEIGKATKEGINKGASASAAGGGAIPPIPKTDAKALWAQIEADAAAMSGGGGAVAAGAAAGVSAAVVLPAVLTALQQASSALESLGDALFEGTKQQLELKDALQRNSESLAMASATMQKMYESSTGGNRNVSSRPAERLAGLDTKIAGLDERLAEYTPTDYFQLGFKYATPIGWLAHGVFGAKTKREQYEEQRAELMTERTLVAQQFSGIRSREKGLGTIGGVANMVSGEMGMEVPANFGPLGTVSMSEAAMLADILRNNNTILQEILKQSTMSYQQQQQRAIDIMRGVEETQR